MGGGDYGVVYALRNGDAIKVGIIFALMVSIAVALADGTAFGTTASCSNPATLAGSAFEVDPALPPASNTGANLIVNTSGCQDWLTGGTGTSFRSGALAKNDKPSGSQDNAFGQGTAENDANPTVVLGSIPPNKSDLKAFGVYTENGQVTAANPTGKNLALFWSRVQNPSGTTNMDFELNQKVCNPNANPTNCANNGNLVPPEAGTPVRTSGDKLITYDLSKGGTVPTISIRTWNGSAWGAAQVISGGANANALGSVNTSLIPANQTGGATGGLTTALGSQDAFTFGEATISFAALFGSGATCGKFGSAYLKSRSSDSFSAEVKDFVAPEQVSISNCASMTTKASGPVTVGSSIKDTATLSDVGANAGGTITFKAFSDSNCSTLVFTSNAIPVSGPGDYTSNDFTPNAAGTYYWTASYTGDANNQSASTACGDANEPSVVNKASPSIATTLSDESITVGDSAHDSATLTGASSDAGGTVTYTVYTDNACSQGARDAGTKTVTNGNVPDSDSLQFNTPGTYFWQAVYSGDANNEGATSECTSEQLVVGKAPSTIATAQELFPQDSVTVSDGATGTPTGNVDFLLYGPNNPTCDPQGAAAVYTESNVALDANGKAKTSNSTFSVSAANSDVYHWKVVYGGDATHDGSTSDCKENFTLTIDNG
jgi:hypothetical protein